MVLYNLTLKTVSIKNFHFGRKALRCNQFCGAWGFLHSINRSIRSLNGGGNIFFYLFGLTRESSNELI